MEAKNSMQFLLHSYYLNRYFGCKLGKSTGYYLHVDLEAFTYILKTKKVDLILLYILYVGIKTVYKIAHDIQHFIRIRTTNKFHIVKLKNLKPNYYEFDTRLAFACYSLLIEFIEQDHIPFYKMTMPELRCLDDVEDIEKILQTISSFRKQNGVDLDEVYQLYFYAKEKVNFDIGETPTPEEYDKETEMLKKIISYRGYYWE